MKKAVLCISILCIFLLNGCSNESQQPTVFKNSETTEKESSIVLSKYDKTKTESMDDSWKYEVAERLYEEMCYFYDNMEEHNIIDMAKKSHKYVNRNKVGYNCVMAIDRGCGIAQVYYKYLSDEKVDDVRNKMFDLDYVDCFSGVQFGYMENGMHFIAIYPEDSDYGTVDDTAKNKIRNLNDEMDFLYEFYNKSDNFLVDIFAEDLSGRKETLSMNLNFVSYNQPYTLDLYELNILSKGIDVVEKYNRNYVSTHDPIKTNSWNLYAFKKQNIHDDIIVVTSEEIVKLYNGIPVKNLL